MHIFTFCGVEEFLPTILAENAKLWHWIMFGAEVVYCILELCLWLALLIYSVSHGKYVICNYVCFIH